MSSGGRVKCPQCGANNFDTVTACWKCGAALNARPPQSSPSAVLDSPVGHTSRQLGAMPSPRATTAAFWLGILFPYIGLPVGLVLMMLDDDRYYVTGRVCVLWSCIALVVHVLFLALVSIGMREILFAIFQGARGAAERAGGMGGLRGYGVP